MNKGSLLLAAIVFTQLTGCADTGFTSTYESQYKRTYNDDAFPEGPSPKESDRITEMFMAQEAEMLSASYAAIRYRFPVEDVHLLAAPGKGYGWSYEERNFKFILSKCSGEASNGKRVVGWLYKIEARSGYAHSGSYVSRLVSAMEEALGQRNISAALVTHLSCGTVADESAGASGTHAGVIRASGTGFFVTSDGYIITNNHVIADASRIDVHVAGGKSYVAKVVTSDANNDVALLKVDAEATPLPIAPTSGIQKGAEVFTLGYPLPDLEGNEPKATFGKVNALSGMYGDIRSLQIDVPIQPGNSGGPLITDEGAVIGITSATMASPEVIRAVHIVPQAVNYAVKSEYILPLLQYAHVQPGGGKLTTAAIKNPSQFERSIVHILVEIGGKSAQTDK